VFSKKEKEKATNKEKTGGEGVECGRATRCVLKNKKQKMCPHTTIYVSSYYIYVSSFCPFAA
jgi:hypothetical protein